jgi:hypothetical protein
MPMTDPGRLNFCEETLDLGTEVLGLPRQLGGCSKHSARSCSCLLSCTGHPRDIGCHLARTHRSLGNVAHDFMGRGSLLLWAASAR